MKKGKQILALAGVIILVLMYVSTLIFALLDSPLSADFFKASLACTIILPVLLYGFALVHRLAQKNIENSEILEEKSSDDSSNK